jgi:cytochrome c oxidase assembly protein subunit 15
MATQTLSPVTHPRPTAGLTRFAWAVVAYNVLVILWGDVVSATGSGNGCGDHWPLCNGSVTPHWHTLASVIEFAHRATAGVDTIAILGLLAWTWRATVTRHLARFWIGAAVFFTFTEGLLGALLVKLQLTTTNHSPMRAAFFSLHLANTLFLLAALTLTAHFLARDAGRMRGGVQLSFGWSSGLALGATLLVGISGSLAALADTLYPATTLRAALAQDISPNSPWMLHLRWAHPALALLTGAAIVFFVMRPLTQGVRVQGGGIVLGLLALQIVLGICDVVLLAPVWLQVLHLLGADCLWIALVVLAARTSLRPLGCMGVACGGGTSTAVKPL